MPHENFYEDDEPVKDVLAAFDAGEPFLTGPHAVTYVECSHHGREVVDVETYRVCGECQHPFRAGELLDAHNGVLASVRTELASLFYVDPADTELVDLSGWDFNGVKPIKDAISPDEVTICPICTHDF